jgi:hypothetical protein
MEIKLIADTSVYSAPAGFTAAIQAAAAIYDELFPGNYTVNIRYGWGTWDNQVDPGLRNANGAEGGPVTGTTVSYATVKSWLTADAQLPVQQEALASLPASFPNDANTFYVSSAEEKAFGVYTGSSSAVDGAIGFGTGTSPIYFLEAALHEIGHALGRTTDYYAGDPTVMDLFRYSAVGTYNWAGYEPSYLSFNGGITAIANFSTVSDYGDFAVDGLTPNDPYNYLVNGSVQTLTNLDIQLMNVLGFGSNATPPDVTVSVVSDVSVQEGQSIAASSLITSIANPHGDSITQHLYIDNGGGSGHFTVNGVAEPDGQWISAGNSDVVQYVGGTSPGSDQLGVGVYDATTNSYAYSSLFSAITTGSQSPSPLGPTDASWHVAGFGDFAGTGGSEMLLRDSNSGQLEIYYVSDNSTGSDASGASTTSNAAISLGQVGLDWQTVGFGSFSGNANETDMLMQDTNTGAFEVYDINNNAVSSAAAMGQVGLNWQVAGFGDFSGNANETDMLLRDSNTGTFEVFDISHNNITLATSMGQVGLNWQIAGFGDFSSNVNETDMLLRDSNTGTFELYDISHNNVTLATSMGQVGLNWQIVSFGDFSGNVNETDMLLRDSNTGTFELYDISHNNITLATSMGQVGLDWQVVGLGDFSGNANETDMLMLNSNTGVFELYDIRNNTITSATSLGQLGLAGQLSGQGAVAPSAPSAAWSPPVAPSPASTDTLFVFLGTFGQNTVEQFNPLVDTIELSATEFANFAAVQSHMQQVGANTVITYDANDTITLVGVSLASLHASNFEFTLGFAQ